MNKDTENFLKAYGALKLASELASEMAGPDGRRELFAEQDVHELKRLVQEAACAASGIHSRHDGRPS